MSSTVAAGSLAVTPAGLYVPAWFPKEVCDPAQVAVCAIEVNSAVSFMRVVYEVSKNYPQFVPLKEGALGSGCSTFLFAGRQTDIEGAVDDAWLRHEVLRREDTGSESPLVRIDDDRENLLIWAHCFPQPSKAFWDFMKPATLSPEAEVIARACDLTGEQNRKTLGVFEVQEMGAFLQAMAFLGRFHRELTYIGFTNYGSKRIAVYFYGDQDQVQTTNIEAENYIRPLIAQGKIKGRFNAFCTLNLGPENKPLELYLPWGAIRKPLGTALANQNTFLGLNFAGIGPLLQAVQAATRRSKLIPHASQALGSGREQAVLSSSDSVAVESATSAVRDAYEADVELKNHLLDIVEITSPQQIFGAHMSELEEAEPTIEKIEEKSIGLIDTVNSGALYEALLVLKNYEVEYIGRRKIGSSQVFAAFAGEQKQVELALEKIREVVGEKLTKGAPNEKVQGKLFYLGIINQPTDELIRLLPWEKPKEKVTVPEGYALPTPDYPRSATQPLGYLEGVGFAELLVAANDALRNHPIVPESVSKIGSGRVLFHFKAENYGDLEGALTMQSALAACSGPACNMPHAQEMLLNANTFAEPGEVLWKAIPEAEPCSLEKRKILKEEDVALGVFTATHTVPNLEFLDQLKRHNVKLWGVEKSGGLHITVVIYGKYADVKAAMDAVTKETYGKFFEEIRSIAIIGNPHPDLVYFLPKEERVGM